MIAVQHKQAPAGKRSSASAARSRPYAVQSVVANTALQRTPSCACGGTCPRCQAKRAQLRAMDFSHGDHVGARADNASERSSPGGEFVALPIQRKLAVGRTDDPAEAEADRIADRVMRMAEPGPIGSTPSQLSRKCEACEKEDESAKLQTKRGCAGTLNGSEAPPIVHEVLRSPGQPLDAATRAFMEPRFGHDFSEVRIHTGARAAQSARGVNAAAYTVGRNVVFGAGEYAPHAATGRKLLAHELVHVAQGAAVSTVERRISRTDEASERAASQLADAAIPGVRFGGSLTNRCPAPAVRRQPDRSSPPTPPGLQLRLSPRLEGGLVIDRFPMGESSLTDLQRKQIAAHAAKLLLLLNPAGSIMVTGHADAVGSESDNWNIGFERARAVRSELVKAGVPEQSINVDSADESDPAIVTGEAEPRNRRAVIGFSPPLELPGFDIAPLHVGNEPRPLDLNPTPETLEGEPPIPSNLQMRQPNPPSPPTRKSTRKSIGPECQKRENELILLPLPFEFNFHFGKGTINEPASKKAGCREACGSGCDTTACEDLEKYCWMYDFGPGLYEIEFPNPVRCKTHRWCEWHDKCFDIAKAGGERGEAQPGHMYCNLVLALYPVVTRLLPQLITHPSPVRFIANLKYTSSHTKNWLSWLRGGGPYADDWLYYVDDPVVRNFWPGKKSTSPRKAQ